MKKTLSALAGLLIAVAALGQLSKYKDWDKSAEAYFLTPAERAEWKKVSSDADAEKFIALYWAKRGGEPFRQEISRRIAAADQQFKMARYKRGSDSVEGRLLVMLGLPSKVVQQRGGPSDAQQAQADINSIDTRFGGAETGVVKVWVYDKDKLAPFGLPELRAQVNVDTQRGSDSLQNSTEVDRAMAVVAEKSIVNPNATATAAPPPSAPAPAPSGSAAAPPPAAAKPAPAAPPAAAPAAPPAAAAPAVMPLPAAVKSALESDAAKGSGDAGFWSGTFRTVSGEPFLAVQFYLPSSKAAFASASTLKFAAVVKDESGKEAASLWEDAAPSEVTEGTRKDHVVDKSIVLPPGQYKGSFGVFASDSQPPLATASADFQLQPKAAEFEVSPLILSNGLVPLTKRPAPTEPFVFGVEKPIKVEPKGDRLFTKQDSLWYFYEVANPTLPAASTEAAPAPAATPAAGASPVPAPTAESPKPRIMTRINVQRDGKDAFAPFTGAAEMQPIAPGYYGAGSEIPLASFEPGYYTFIINVRDLNAPRGSPANSKGIERKAEFVVLKDDGSLPAKGAAAPAPTKPKKPS